MHQNIVHSKLNTLRSLAVERSWPVGGWRARTAVHLGPGQYEFDGPWKKVSLPFSAPAGKTIFLEAVATAPAGLDLKNAFLDFAFDDLESLLSIDGKPYAGVDWGHRRVQVPRRGRMKLEIESMSVPVVYWDPGLRRS